MAGILRPTSGTVDASGRIASLLELGAGFNGELSGRDNIYLNASLLGLTRRETDAAFDSIVEFSELGEFIDSPVKHYSSGMYVRLGFAVAVHVEPDILLVDEVLAVGDEHFRRKCLDKIRRVPGRGPHDPVRQPFGLDLVEQICARGVVLDHGRIGLDGDPYFATGRVAQDPRHRRPGDDEAGGGRATGARIRPNHVRRRPGGREVSELAPGEPMRSGSA